MWCLRSLLITQNNNWANLEQNSLVNDSIFPGQSRNWHLGEKVENSLVETNEKLFLKRQRDWFLEKEEEEEEEKKMVFAGDLFVNIVFQNYDFQLGEEKMTL